jgi:hypothetical protein
MQSKRLGAHSDGAVGTGEVEATLADEQHMQARKERVHVEPPLVVDPTLIHNKWLGDRFGLTTSKARNEQMFSALLRQQTFDGALTRRTTRLQAWWSAGVGTPRPLNTFMRVSLKLREQHELRLERNKPSQPDEVMRMDRDFSTWPSFQVLLP